MEFPVSAQFDPNQSVIQEDSEEHSIDDQNLFPNNMTSEFPADQIQLEDG